MSIGNSDNSNNKGKNFPFQHNMLKGIQKLIDAGESDKLTLIANILAGKVRVEDYDEIPPGETGTIGTGARSYSVFNVGDSDALFNGKTLRPGMSVDVTADGQADVLSGLTYDTQATTLAVVMVV